MVAFMIVSWALNFVIGKIALREIPALVLPGLRIALAAILLIPIYLWRRPKQKFKREDWPKLILTALCGITFNQFFFIAGLSRTSVAHMAVFIAVTPILVLVLAVMTGQERFSLGNVAGMLLAMAGVLAIELSNQSSGVATPFGDLLAFMGTAAFSVYTVLGKDLTARYGSISMNMLSYSIGTVTLLPLSWIYRGSFHASQVSSTGWLSLAYMVVFSSVIAYLVYYYALSHMPASRLAAFTYVEPVLAAVLGYWMLSEPVTWALAFGGAMVLAGVWVAERAR